MPGESVLARMAREVITGELDAFLLVAARLLGLRLIGAAVVVRADKTILGILSERDIVRVLGEHGAGALEMRVQDAMTSKVSTCREGNTINEVMELMTRGRFRHLPVEKEGRLDGIVSIGDFVKRRIEDVEREAEQIREYIATA